MSAIDALVFDYFEALKFACVKLLVDETQEVQETLHSSSYMRDLQAVRQMRRLIEA
jgi:hypothetical protein